MRDVWWQQDVLGVRWRGVRERERCKRDGRGVDREVDMGRDGRRLCGRGVDGETDRGVERSVSVAAELWAERRI